MKKNVQKILKTKLLVTWLILFVSCNLIANINKYAPLEQPFSTQNDSPLKVVYQKLLKEYNKGAYISSLKSGFLLFQKSKKNKNHKFTYLTAMLIADIYDKTNNYNKSLEYYKIALHFLEKNNNSFSQENEILATKAISAEIYLRIGSAYQKNYSTQLKKNKEKANTSKDSAIFFYNKLQKLDFVSEKNLKNKALSYINLSGIYQQDSLFEKAKNFALKAITIHQKRNDNVKHASSLNNLASIYLSLNQFKKAKNTYLEAIGLIQDNNSPVAVKHKSTLYYNLAWAMRNLKDYKAYDYQELSYDIQDNQREKEVRSIIEEITVKHKETLEQQKVNLVTEQRKLVEAKDNKTTWLFGALSLLVIIISAGIVYNYKLRQKNLQLKLSENNLREQQAIEKIKSETQTKILNATIDAKESERKQIAEILHDNVSALLSSANMHLGASKKQFKGSIPLEIEKTQGIILEASEKVRDLSHNLISSILLKFGLEYALKDVAKKYSNCQLQFDVSAQNIDRYQQDFEMKIYNIIQELANNILKHSEASYAQIIIKQDNDALNIFINDDGIGFSTEFCNINNGIGLKQISARIEMMKGTFTIKSDKNKGTKITIIVPIKHKETFDFSSIT
ncbi:tetratricopeptide repeat-containing sensor histidine kinase [Tenacibaculum finnmarkense]|uniref:tetratricopeptide repeat-containing sensor histidine kinase n=1 Tax=Tenacibaculum finnmarkense TaxID=2781243 RepID=UPI001E33D61E|nr:tetratricopeptide repeat-containing sensor histidine kinase [Tenacibaculum finnmarkense]MCD8423164.1 tetratricopeptide repeat protein [Tenacibaculum finnmarkense genomovar ulcerans]MCG8239379.1 tetratricopeptide repeat protein [Tenacibaculum finnmarkense genomovar ulcerans]